MISDLFLYILLQQLRIFPPLTRWFDVCILLLRKNDDEGNKHASKQEG